jgi:hypothetical protein
MENEDLDLSKMTVEDLFRAKKERRQRLANLPFEQKIEIVKKLQSVSRAARGINDRYQRPEAEVPANSR